MSATRYGGRRVNDVLVTSNIPVRQENGGRRSIRRLPSPARVTGYAVLETTKSWKLRSLGHFHQQRCDAGYSDSWRHPANEIMRWNIGLRRAAFSEAAPQPSPVFMH